MTSTPDAAEREAAPDRIFLIAAPADVARYSSEATWSRTRVNRDDVEYVRRAPEPAREANAREGERPTDLAGAIRWHTDTIDALIYDDRCDVATRILIADELRGIADVIARAQPAPQQGGEVHGEIHAIEHADGTRSMNSRGDIRALTLWLAQTEGGLPDEIQRCITERDQARGALLLLGYEGAISQSRARELLSMPIEDQRRWYREQFATPAPAAPAEVSASEIDRIATDVHMAVMGYWNEHDAATGKSFAALRAALAAALAAQVKS